MADAPALSNMTSERHWTDWVNVVAGIWLFASPWALAFGTGTAAAWNAWILGIVIAAVALVGFSDERTEWANVVVAICLFISPWFLRFYDTAQGMAWNCWIVSVVVFFVALAGATQATGTYAHGHGEL